MKKTYLVMILAAAAAILGAAVAAAAPLPKVTICHIPPGNPANWHTITISQNALQKHIDLHGDLVGTCQENCETLCDDGDFCTIDCTQAGECEPEPRPPVDCDMGGCFTDFCDPGSGCVNDPITCEDDGNLCTIEACDPIDGCVATPVVCPDGETCDPGTGLCEPPVGGCDPDSGPFGENPACPPPTAQCTVGFCLPVLGCAVVPLPPTWEPDGTACTDFDPDTAEECISGMCTETCSLDQFDDCCLSVDLEACVCTDVAAENTACTTLTNDPGVCNDSGVCQPI